MVARRTSWFHREAMKTLAALTGVAAAGLVLLLPAASALVIFAWWAVVIALFEAGESLASGSRRVLVSVLSLALGLFVLAGPVHDPSLLLLAVALYAVLGVAGNDESWNRGRRRVSAAGESVEWRQARLPRCGRAHAARLGPGDTRRGLRLDANPRRPRFPNGDPGPVPPRTGPLPGAAGPG